MVRWVFFFFCVTENMYLTTEKRKHVQLKKKIANKTNKDEN